MALTAYVSQGAIVYEPSLSKVGPTANREDTMTNGELRAAARRHGQMREHRLLLRAPARTRLARSVATSNEPVMMVRRIVRNCEDMVFAQETWVQKLEERLP